MGSVGGVLLLVTFGLLVVSIPQPRWRALAGVMVLAWSVAFFAVGVWRLADDRTVHVGRWAAFVALTALAGGLLLRSGLRAQLPADSSG